MINKKGMTLIELIVVMVIISLVLLFAFPVIDKIIITSNEKKYDYYYEIVKEGALTYSENKIDALGSITDRGCIEVDLSYLIDREFITDIDKKDIECSGKIRINNDLGKKNTFVNLSCIDASEDNKVIYEKEEIPSSTCEEYSPQGDLSIYDSIKNNPIGDGSIKQEDNNMYIIGTNPNNYVWYSGKLWRMYYSNGKGVNDYIKMISEDAITVLPYGYNNINVFTWYEGNFINTLKDREDYLQKIWWDTLKIDNKINNYVGLLTTEELNKIENNSYLTSDKPYLVLNGSNGNAYNYSSALEPIRAELFTGIRPVVALSSNLIVTNGNGTYDSPYILEGNSGNVSGGTQINTRYSGEYIKLDNQIYRIVRIAKIGGKKVTKVTSIDPVLTINFNDQNETFYFSESTIKNNYLTPWLNKQRIKNLVYKGEWCEQKIETATDLFAECNKLIDGLIGLPELQEIYTSNFTNSDYNILTMTPHSNDDISDGDKVYKINIINKDNTINNQIVTNVGAKSRVSMYLNENVLIKSGNGTRTNPYVVYQ